MGRQRPLLGHAELRAAGDWVACWRRCPAGVRYGYVGMDRVFLLVLVGGAMLAWVACTPSSATKAGDPPAECAKAGDRCTFSPGKLGVCAESANGGPSLACQSLH